jgi:hypothetical protein
MLNKQISLRTLLLFLALVLVPLVVVGCGDQVSASNNNAATAGNKWGTTPNISNFYEYEQMIQIYEARDNPKLVLNAYLYDSMTNSLACLGKVKGFGIPYGTEMSPPNSQGQGSVPEPNALYPSTSTNADWVLLIGPDGKTHLTFVEPNLIITDMALPCKPLT